MRSKKVTMLDLVVLNYNDSETTISFVNAIKNYDSINTIVVVDNCSEEEEFKKILSIKTKKIIVLRSYTNGGYAKGNNLGISYCLNNLHSKYIAISNPDVIICEEVICECVTFLSKHSEFTMVAPSMKNLKNQIVGSAWKLRPWFKYASAGLRFSKHQPFLNECQNITQEYAPCDCLAGSFFVLDGEQFLKIGLFDEKTFLYCEETILGFKNGQDKSAVLLNSFFVHAHSTSINKTYKSELKKKKMLWKSKRYVLYKYYRINFIKKVVVEILRLISLIETFFSSIKTKA